MRLLVTGSSHAIKLHLAMRGDMAAEFDAAGVTEIDWMVTGGNFFLIVDTATGEVSPPADFMRKVDAGRAQMFYTAEPTLLRSYHAILYSAFGLRPHTVPNHPVWAAVKQPLSDACLREMAFESVPMRVHTDNIEAIRRAGYRNEIFFEPWPRPVALADGVDPELWRRMCQVEDDAVASLAERFNAHVLPRPPGCDTFTPADLAQSDAEFTHGNVAYGEIVLGSLLERVGR